MAFAIAPGIISHFSRDETAGGPRQLRLFRQAPWSVVNGMQAAGALVPVTGYVGNVAPVPDTELTADDLGKRSDGFVDVYSIREIGINDEAAQGVSWYVLHKGLHYKMYRRSNWHYANGFVYRAFHERERDGA